MRRAGGGPGPLSQRGAIPLDEIGKNSINTEEIAAAADPGSVGTRRTAAHRRQAHPGAFQDPALASRT
jgi:hypothetical protein